LTQEKITLGACGVNLALWAAFQVMDEVLLSYPLETTHRAIFISQVATLLALGLLQCGTDANDGATEYPHRSPERDATS
jgi:hypothetical protein